MPDQSDVLNKFRDAVEEIRGEVPTFDHTTLLPEVGIDSLDLIEVGMLLEDDFGIRLDEKSFEGAESVGDVVAVVTQHLQDAATE